MNRTQDLNLASQTPNTLGLVLKSSTLDVHEAIF